MAIATCSYKLLFCFSDDKQRVNGERWLKTENSDQRSQRHVTAPPTVGTSNQ